MTREELEAIAFRHIPIEYCRQLLHAVFVAHKVASDDCQREFAASEIPNVAPWYRRGKLEAYMRDASGRHPGLQASVAKASNWNHTEIWGGPVVLTQNAVPTPCGLIDPAEFRLDLAAETIADDGQQTLFPLDDGPVDDGPLLLVLLHSRSVWPTRDERREFGHLPGSAYIAFPSRDLKRYVHDINLFELFPEVLAAHMPSAWDEEALVRYVQRSHKTATG